MLTLFYRTLFILLHYLYSLVLSVHKIWIYLTAKVHHAENLQQEEQYIKSIVPQLSKYPNHLVIILGTENPSYPDLARMIIWAISAGIHEISLYDYKGILKKSVESVQNAIFDMKKELLDHIAWDDVNVIKPNKIDPSKKVVIHILSFLDGQQFIVQAAKTLAVSDNNNLITIETIDKQVNSRLKIQDPNLGIVCGGLFSTYGFLPWHIRTTEFLELETHHNIRVDTFAKILFRYADSRQRWGK